VINPIVRGVINLEHWGCGPHPSERFVLRAERRLPISKTRQPTLDWGR